MKAFFLKYRKFTGWLLIALSILLMLVAFITPFFPSISASVNIESSLGGVGFFYILSIPPWYLGLTLLGPEIIAKTKEYYSVIKNRIWRKE